MSAADWCHFHIGSQGSGKTYRLKAKVAAFVRLGYCARGARVLVADVKSEWPRARSEPSSPLTVGAHVDVALCSRGRVPKLDALAHVTVCRPLDALDVEGTRAWADSLCRAALKRGSVVLVLPEVWRYAPERGYGKGGIVEGLAAFVHEHRHHDCALWCDSQRYAEAAKELVDRCGVHFVHGVGSLSDLERLGRMGGRALESATQEVMRLNETRPGHHLVWQSSRPFGPFTIYGPDSAVIGTRSDTR